MRAIAESPSFKVGILPVNLRPAVKHETDKLFSLRLKARQVAFEFEGRSAPFDRFGNALIYF